MSCLIQRDETNYGIQGQIQKVKKEGQDPNSGKRGPENSIWMFISVFFS